MSTTTKSTIPNWNNLQRAHTEAFHEAFKEKIRNLYHEINLEVEKFPNGLKCGKVEFPGETPAIPNIEIIKSDKVIRIIVIMDGHCFLCDNKKHHWSSALTREQLLKELKKL